VRGITRNVIAARRAGGANAYGRIAKSRGFIRPRWKQSAVDEIEIVTGANYAYPFEKCGDNVLVMSKGKQLPGHLNALHG
jgi:hypothetical protein